MTHKTCHGCEGKGWVLIIRSEVTKPWLDQLTRKPVPECAMQTREYEAALCPICRGEGVVGYGPESLARELLPLAAKA